MKKLAQYKNGNYTVTLYEDGTKIRANNLDNLTPEFAESMDVNITTKCDGGCKYCYLNCTENGVHGDLNNPIFDTVHPGTEIAINGNDLTHSNLEDFLIKMKNKHIIVNITINQKHFLKNIDKLKNWQNRQLIWGIGISLIDSTDKDFLNSLNKLNNIVIHVIDGCFTKNDLENLKNYDIKLLILGFKHKGRGVDYYNKNKDFVDNNIEFLKNHLYDYKKYYNGFGFDYLSTINLNIEQLVGPEKWAKHHMGEEGEFTYYLDLINNKYAISSMETEMYDMLDSVDDMFKDVRKKQGFDV